MSFVNFINRCGTMVIAYMMLYLTTKVDCTLSQAGAVIGVYGVGAIIGSFSGGRFTDKIGFYKVQIVTLLFGGLMFIILGQLKSYTAILVCTFFLGLINEAFRPANSAAIAQYSTNENRMRSFSLMRLSFNLGWAFGGGLGGLIAGYSYHLLFWIDGCTNIVAAILLWQLIPYNSREHVVAKPKEGTVLNTAYKDKVFLLFTGISLIYTACFFQLFSNLSAFFKREGHFTEQFIGMLLSWNGMLIVFIEMAVVFWMERHWSKRRAVVTGVSLHVIAYLLLVVFAVNKELAFVAMTFITLSEMLSFSVLTSFWMQRTDEHNRGQYAGIWTMTWAVAQTTGPLLGSILAEYAGFKVLWIVIASMSALAAYLYSRLIRH